MSYALFFALSLFKEKTTTRKEPWILVAYIRDNKHSLQLRSDDSPPLSKTPKLDESLRGDSLVIDEIGQEVLKGSAQASHSETSALLRSESTQWIPEDLQVSQAVRASLLQEGLEPEWIDTALAINQHVQALFAQTDREAVVIPGVNDAPNLCYVKSESNHALLILPSLIGRGASKIIYKVMDLTDAKISAFAKLCIDARSYIGDPLTLLDIKESTTESNRPDEVTPITRKTGPLLIRGASPHLLRLHEVRAMNGQAIGFLSPFIQGGNLSQKLSDKSNAYCFYYGPEMILQSLEGLKVLHDEGLCHRDIKGINIMIDDASSCSQAVVIDLDGVMPAHTNLTSSEEILAHSSELYLSPELFILMESLDNQAAKASASPDERAPLNALQSSLDLRPADIWAMGVTFFSDILSRGETFLFMEAAKNPERLRTLLASMEEKIKEQCKLWPECIQPLVELAQRIFCSDPCERCTIDEMVQRVRAIHDIGHQSARLEKFAKR